MPKHIHVTPKDFMALEARRVQNVAPALGRVQEILDPRVRFELGLHRGLNRGVASRRAMGAQDRACGGLGHLVDDVGVGGETGSAG